MKLKKFKPNPTTTISIIVHSILLVFGSVFLAMHTNTLFNQIPKCKHILSFRLKENISNYHFHDSRVFQELEIHGCV